ncbi:MAG TPA: transglutaminase family protein [Tepidisphaeraceae bacterium]|nr:transglutaminase family protein [Tepidisphaeraceae bacterium]
MHQRITKADPHIVNPNDKLTVRELAALSDESLAQVDVLYLNLAVAREFPGVEQLNIQHYQRIVDEWSGQAAGMLAKAEPEFHKSPQLWQDDIRFFRLACIAQFMRRVLRIRYNQEYERSFREAESQSVYSGIRYSHVHDQFLHALIDLRQGTCASIPVLYLAIARRLDLPVYLTQIDSHLMCRFEDGQVTYNIDVTDMKDGGFSAPADDDLLISKRAIRFGSDFKTLTAREMLGYFLSQRGRIFRDIGQLDRADSDYCLARWLLPRHRYTIVDGIGIAFQQAEAAFDPGERFDPLLMARALVHRYEEQRNLPLSQFATPHPNPASGRPQSVHYSSITPTYSPMLIQGETRSCLSQPK